MYASEFFHEIQVRAEIHLTRKIVSNLHNFKFHNYGTLTNTAEN